MFLVGKWGVQTTFEFPMVKRGVVDLAVAADWTPATGDTKISKDQANVANTTNNPAAVGGTGSALWSVTLTATEMQAASIALQIVDAATKAVEDQMIRIYTYGNASAKFVPDWSDGVRMGLTALPNAAAGGNGGLPTGDASGSVKFQTSSKKNQALNGYPFIMTDSTSHAPVTGKSVTLTRSIDGGAFGAGTLGAVTEISNGWYKTDFPAADMNGNTVAVRASASGCDDTDITFTLEP